MRQRRTCIICNHKDTSDKLTHKGNSQFICKDSHACNSRLLTRLQSSNVVDLNDYRYEDDVVELDNLIPFPGYDNEPKLRKYVVTTAVIGCPATPALKTLEYYCKENGAELIVLTIKYKNIEKADGYISDWLDSDLNKYALYGRKEIGSYIQLVGDIQISPTAVNPLTGLAPICKGKTTVFPTTQLVREPLAVGSNQPDKAIWGTGCITEPIYSDSSAGYKGKFHHAISAIVIEEDLDGDFFIRNLPVSSKDYSLIDFGRQYHVDEWTTDCLDYNLVLGDIHVGSHCPDNHEAINKLVRDMGTANAVILHDVFDGATINHHELDNPFARTDLPFDSLYQELEANVNYLEGALSDWSDKVYIVDSNHHDFITKWILAVDWKSLDVETCKVYLAISLAVMGGKIFNIYQYALELTQALPENIVFLDTDESLVIYENELGIHGHAGANGARGSKNAWVNSGNKTITGHTHAPFINKSAFGTGTSTHRKLGYTKGFSSWANTHVIEYETGKRQQFTTVNGKYRG